jgi:hypothetical protein
VLIALVLVIQLSHGTELTVFRGLKVFVSWIGLLGPSASFINTRVAQSVSVEERSHSPIRCRRAQIWIVIFVVKTIPNQIW